MTFSPPPWTKIGVVATIVWLAGACWLAQARLHDAQNQVLAVLLEQCLPGGDAGLPTTACGPQATATANRIVRWNMDRVLAFALVALGPLPFAWLGGWLLLAMPKRVRAWRASFASRPA